MNLIRDESGNRPDITAVIQLQNGILGYFWDIDQILSQSQIGENIKVYISAIPHGNKITKMQNEKYELIQTYATGWTFKCSGKIVNIDNEILMDVGCGIIDVDVQNISIGEFISFEGRLDIGAIWIEI